MGFTNNELTANTTPRNVYLSWTRRQTPESERITTLHPSIYARSLRLLLAWLSPDCSPGFGLRLVASAPPSGPSWSLLVSGPSDTGVSKTRSHLATGTSFLPFAYPRDPACPLSSLVQRRVSLLSVFVSSSHALLPSCSRNCSRPTDRRAAAAESRPLQPLSLSPSTLSSFGPSADRGDTEVLEGDFRLDLLRIGCAERLSFLVCS